jgi:uncharacterized protein (TIGR02453 family)
MPRAAKSTLTTNRRTAAADAASPHGSFAGFGPKALDFFRALDFHQTREWFVENKDLYERDVKAPMAALIVDLAALFTARGVPLRGDPKSSMFKLNRDVRFSKDKRPYKTHAGAVLTREGTKTMLGLLYIHIDPNGPFVGAGFYHPQPDALFALRAAIRDRLEAFAVMEKELAGAGLALDRSDALTRLPRGFDGVPSDSPAAAAIKLKSLIVRRPVEPDHIFRPDLTARIAAFAEEALPLLRFGWSALDTARGQEMAEIAEAE